MTTISQPKRVTLKLYRVWFNNSERLDGYFVDFEAYTKDDARTEAELYLYDEASGFAGEKGYTLNEIERV